MASSPIATVRPLNSTESAFSIANRPSKAAGGSVGASSIKRPKNCSGWVICPCMRMVEPSMLSPGSSRPPISNENRSDWLLTSRSAPVPSPVSDTVPVNGPLNSAGRSSTEDQTLREGISTVPDSRPLPGDRKSATVPVSFKFMTSLISLKVETSTCVPSREVFRSISKGVSGQFACPPNAPRCARLGPVATRSSCAEDRVSGSSLSALPKMLNSPNTASRSRCATAACWLRLKLMSTGPSSMRGSDSVSSSSLALSVCSVKASCEASN